jgi:DHA2 family methylenomycin A resistance protein-like MFS transporter
MPTRRIPSLVGTLPVLTTLATSTPPIVLGHVADQFGTSRGSTAWVLVSFNLALGVMTPLAGDLSDRHGPRRVIRGGALGLTLGCLISCFAPNLAVLIAGRAAQGVSVGAIASAAFTALGTRPALVDRARVLALLTAGVSLILGVGPLIGGELAAALGWRTVFALPVIAAATALGASAELPRVTQPRGRTDLREVAVFSLAAAGLLTLVQAPETHLSPLAVAALGSIALLAIALFVRGVRLGRAGFVSGAFRNLRLSPLRYSIVAAASLGAANLGMAFLVPVLISSYHPSWSLLHIGAVMLPGATIPITASLLTGIELRNRSARTAIAILASASAAGIVCVVLAGGVVTAVIASGTATAGFAGGQVLLLSLIPELIPNREVGLTMGFASMLFVLGGAGGAAVTGLLVQVGNLRLAAIGDGCLALAALVSLVPESFHTPAIGLVSGFDAKEEA